MSPVCHHFNTNAFDFHPLSTIVLTVVSHRTFWVGVCSPSVCRSFLQIIHCSVATKHFSLALDLFVALNPRGQRFEAVKGGHLSSNLLC